MAKPTRPEVFFGGAAVACVVACVAVFLWKKWPEPATLGTKGEWVGALATLAAALTAVAIAFWSHRRNKIDTMMEGAFEIVAAEYVMRQIKGQASVFHRRLTRFIAQLADINSQIARCDQIVNESQSAHVMSPSDAASSFDKLVRAESQRPALEHKKDEDSTRAMHEFAGYVESLQAQAATLSHVKMAAFDPAVGLAVVKAKALLRRSEGLVKMAATTSDLLECLNKVRDLLGIFEAAIPAA
ncbi:hypothetical protein [Achromobacter sp. PAB15]|uniref:hypothetical protein n=1 Tax=Achromobacter sp. PAB15 TaxID=3233048 RepID=UPI003F8F0B79